MSDIELTSHDRKEIAEALWRLFALWNLEGISIDFTKRSRMNITIYLDGSSGLAPDPDVIAGIITEKSGSKQYSETHRRSRQG